jgi:hypothetical protein
MTVITHWELSVTTFLGILDSTPNAEFEKVVSGCADPGANRFLIG